MREEPPDGDQIRDARGSHVDSHDTTVPTGADATYSVA
jgi:hypothetical protein